ncbi:uncharacterized protein LOC124848525 [Vigna umbellata]|uniref:uncharacterized protein LOC124848525 n=1 Tax=Vigna umbellata TaxID=87088 RepID=UPI001F5FBE17|nr:uncharacterized protein LOC124848525 [Vigna umbellata]
MFIRQFASSCVQDTTIFDLVNLKQGKEETLKALMDCYQKLGRRAKGLNPEFTLQYILPALKPGPFKDNVCRCAPKTMEDLHERAVDKIRAEEMKLSYKKESQEAQSEKKDGKKFDNQSNRPEGAKQREPPRGPRSRYNSRSVRDGEARYSRTSVKDQDMVEIYCSRSEKQRIRSRERSNDSPLRGHINTISVGGVAGGGSSSSVRKPHIRALRSVHAVDRSRRTMPPITFTNEDFHALDPDHDDPMVITAEIARYSISKVLIDQRSSVNILYWKTFQQMDILDDLIIPYNEQMVGFASERVDTRGYVNLRTRLGNDRDTKEKRVRFLLVEDNTSYNVLLGQPCLTPLGLLCQLHTSP